MKNIEILENINLDILTEKEAEAVKLRLERYTYEEIGGILGCTRQCIEQRVKKALIKNNRHFTLSKQNKNLINEKMRILEARLTRRKDKLKTLETTVKSKQLEIAQIENELSNLKAYSQNTEVANEN